MDFEQAVVDNGITHIIHLAALQIPFVVVVGAGRLDAKRAVA